MALATDAEGKLLTDLIMAKGNSQPVIDSYNHFINHRMPLIMSSSKINTLDNNIATFINPICVPPMIKDLKGNGRQRPIYPYEVRRKGTSYVAELFATLTIKRNINGRLVPDPSQDITVFLGKIPVLLGSQLDRLFKLTPQERLLKGEGEDDPGGYFIIKGIEKVLLNIEKLRTNAPYLYEDKDGKYNVRYTSQTLLDTTVVIVKEVSGDVHVTFTKIGISKNTINIFYVFYMLGLLNNTVEQAYTLMDTFIVDPDLQRQARRRRELRYFLQSTANTYNIQVRGSMERLFEIFATKFSDPDIINSSDRNIRIASSVRVELFKNIPLTRENVSSELLAKLRLLASMIVKYVEFKNGYREPDDRDSWGNKRVVDVGSHMETRFVKIWEGFMNSIQNKVTNNRFSTVLQIKSAIGQNYITEQFISSFGKELWGTGKGQRDVTVVDTLKRDTKLAVNAHIRRLSAPTNRKAKIRDKRMIHNTQFGVICPAASPEGSNCKMNNELVTLSDGRKIEIKDLKDGDEIVTIDPNTLEASVTKIHHHFTKRASNIVKVIASNGCELVCTQDHPFLTQREWVEAGNLEPNVDLVAISNHITEFQKQTDLSFKEWLDTTKGKGKKYCVFMPVAKVESHPDCLVCDFTTESETHSMIGDSFITHNCGLVKDASVTAYVSLERDEAILRSRIDTLYLLGPKDNNIYPIYLNGVHLGYCDTRQLHDYVVNLRRSRQIPFDTGIILDQYKSLWIYTTAGRMCVPLLIVDKDSQLLLIDQKNLRGTDILTLMTEGVLEFIDVAEQEQIEMYIAETTYKLREKREKINGIIQRYNELQSDQNALPSELESARVAYESLQKERRFTHAMVDPTSILGISTSIIPFPEFIQGPRVTYQCLHPDTRIAMKDSSYKAIKDIKLDDEVFTFESTYPHKITTTKVINHYIRTTKKRIVRVTSNTGRSIVCTEDHLFMTDSGWVPAADLCGKHVINMYTQDTIMPHIVTSVETVTDMGTMIADITTESDNHSFFAEGFGVHNSSMGKQALGPNSARFELRFDTTAKTISEPGVPLVATDAHEILGLDRYPAGQQVIIAITTYGGQNQEDAIIFNEASVRRGLFKLMIYHSYKTTVCHSNKHREEIRVPDYPKSQAQRFNKLDPTTGIVRIGAHVNARDCLVGKVMIDNVTGEVKNVSLYVDIGKEGTVDEVFETENAERCKLIRIRIREYRDVEPGDKLASRYSQKGTIGAFISERDMPEVTSPNPAVNGIKPDIIFNPHGIPSRMTIGKLMEIVIGKAAAVTGERMNATAFRRFDPTTIRNELMELGFSPTGKEKMLNGMTGRIMDADIFFGSVYYQQLKHLVKDKMQARATGVVQFLTRQPISGIRKQGGLRLGGMERDALIAHGASYLLQERFVVSSDAYQAIVCQDCGTYATSNIEKGDTRCRKCPSSRFGRITTPYTMKLMVQLLAGANINVRFKTKEVE